MYLQTGFPSNYNIAKSSSNNVEYKCKFVSKQADRASEYVMTAWLQFSVPSIALITLTWFAYAEFPQPRRLFTPLRCEGLLQYVFCPIGVLRR